MDIVSAVQRALVGKVGAKLVELWASDGVSWQLDGQSLTILARCSFRLERLRRYRAEFQAVACEIVGSQATIDLKLNAVQNVVVQPESVAAPVAVAPTQRELPGLSASIVQA